MLHLQRMGGDLRRVIRGTVAFYRHLREPECIQLGLGLFAAEASRVELGQLSRYFAKIANVSGDSRHVKVGIEIYAMNTVRHSDEHCGHLTKALTLQPHTAVTIEVRYDWLTRVCFWRDGTPSPPDEFWNMDVHPPRLCAVNALLLDPEGRRLEQLTIYQEVSG